MFLMAMEELNPDNEGMFVQLYEQYRHLMFKVAKGILNDEYLAEDALHEAFVRLYGNMDKIDSVASNRTKRYLVTISKNIAIDMYRKRRMSREMFYNEAWSEISVTYEYDDADIDNRILNILRNLPEKYRDIFLLKYSSGYSNQEISEILNIPEGTIRQRIARGKKKIEDKIINLGV